MNRKPYKTHERGSALLTKCGLRILQFRSSTTETHQLPLAKHPSQVTCAICLSKRYSDVKQ